MSMKLERVKASSKLEIKVAGKLRAKTALVSVQLPMCRRAITDESTVWEPAPHRTCFDVYLRPPVVRLLSSYVSVVEGLFCLDAPYPLNRKLH